MNTQLTDYHPLTRPEAPTPEVEHIKPELRARLAPLESQGLLAAGIRTVLQENGYGPALLRKHCGCHACAQRCSICAQTYNGQI